jgi:hexosaminidase
LSAPASRILRTAALALGFALSAGATGAQVLPLVPMPQKIARQTGSFTVGATTAITTSDAGASAAARLLVDHVRTERGLALRLADGGAIRFVRDPAVAGAEAYTLAVTPSGIVLTAASDAGFVNAAMTLAQLISPDRAFGQPTTIPALMIEDAPRFGWRGLMIDPARHFLPLPALYTIVDQMAAVKLNTLHLHLTDDQGWRFEVKKYPKLTAIGSWRTPPSSGGALGPRVGGFYTQAELKGLVAYARTRNIVIVPEIDLPGHAQALVAAYPELGVLGDRPDVSQDWGVNPYLFNPGPHGVAFVKALLDEVMEIFPGSYIHLGGDEAVKDQWERSPVVQAQIKTLGLKDENALQSWLIDQFGRYLADHGRRLIGWDEILEGGLPPSASVMSWRGEQGAVDAASQGHDVVLSPAPKLYFDNSQSNLGDEPPGRLGIQTLADVYRYDPMPAGLAADKAKHVLGAQANAWSEYLVTPYQVQHALFPRIGALAEKTWSAAGTSSFADFVARLDPQIARWRRSGVEVADSGFAVAYTLQGTRGDALRAGKATVALATQVPWGTIRYTLDGTDPTSRSKVYATPLTLKPGITVRAAAYDRTGTATAAPRAFDSSRAALLTRTTSDLVACPSGPLGLRVPLASETISNGPAFSINVFDTCAVYPQAPLDVARGFTVDVARLPRNYGLAHDITKLRAYYNVTPHGELILSIGCLAADPAKDAKPVVLASFPLPDPRTAPAQFRFTGTLPKVDGDQDICLTFTSPLSDPFYAVARLHLTERAR